MFRVAICDDDPFFAQQIRDQLARLEETQKIEFLTESYLSAEELRQAPFDYDILFLDIRLDHGEDGIELGKELRQKGNEAIFILTTSMTDRFSDGYEATVYRYLVKPVNAQKFDEAVMGSIRRLSHYTDRLCIRYKTEMHSVAIANVVYIESYQRKRIVVVKDSSNPCEFLKYPTVEPLDSFEARLSKERFFRPQKSFLIHFEGVLNTSKAQLTMVDDRKIPFIKGRYPAFNIAFTNYLHTNGG